MADLFPSYIILSIFYLFESFELGFLDSLHKDMLLSILILFIYWKL